MQKNKILGAYTFFILHKHIPASIIMEIIYLFIIIKLNAQQIKEKLANSKYQILSYSTICSILENIRKCIATYLKHLYRIKRIGGEPQL